jgi:hypothetical protein
MKRAIWVVIGSLALASVAGCAKKGAAECKAWIDRSLACDADLKDMSADERDQAVAMIQGICEEAMSGKDPGGSGEAAAMAQHMLTTVRAEVACVSANSCDQFNACEEQAHHTEVP